MKLIDKDALVAEIEKLRDELQEKVETSDFIAGEVFIMNYFISLLDFIEVKEVDLEIPMWVREVPREDVFDDGWRIGFDDCLHRKGYKIKICDLWKLPKEPLNV